MNNVQRLPDFSPEPILQKLPSAQHANNLLSTEAYAVYASTLQEYSSNSIDDVNWDILYMDGLKQYSLHFDSLHVSEEELRLIKAYMVDTLSHYSSPTTCIRRLKHVTYLFQFLHYKNFSIRMLSTHTINIFRLWLDANRSLSATKKNNIEATLKSFIPFLQNLNLVRPGNIVIPKPRPLPVSKVIRAPEKAHMQKLDKYFFDFTNTIPTAYRCIYLICRLIPTRNSEVLNILINGFSVDEDLFELWIPTYKETANHEPVYEPYYRLANEFPELILLQSLREQRTFAESHQTEIAKDPQKGRLMVSNKNSTRLVTIAEFNSYLKKVCKNLNLTNHDGTPANITMYSLRHANGAELSANTEITASEFTRVFSHVAESSDDGYGYPSEYDELLQTAQTTQAVRDTLLSGIMSNCSSKGITNSRLKKMQKDCNTNLIGTNSVCQQKGCTPQFEQCVYCDSYIPDPQYIPDAEICCDILRKRIETCKQRGDSTLREFNEGQLNAYCTFISRAST